MLIFLSESDFQQKTKLIIQLNKANNKLFRPSSKIPALNFSQLFLYF